MKKLFYYTKIVDCIITKQFIFSSNTEEDIIYYILQHPQQFELPECFTSESGINIYICDKESLFQYWSYQSYSTDYTIQCEIKEILPDIFL